MDIEYYARTSPQYYSKYVPRLLEQYLLKNNGRVNYLDCGCGDGALLYALKSRGLLIHKKVFAVDFSTTRVNIAKNIDEKMTVVVDNAETLETIDDASIDFFVSTQVVEHIDDIKMIAAIKRTVRSDGIIYISTVFKKWYGWYFYRCNGKWVLDPTHLREYTSDEELLSLFDDDFSLLENNKTLYWFPLVDYFLKRIDKKRIFYRHNKLVDVLRTIKIPILGYYDWEIVLRRK